MAMGMAQQLREPVALICTSGTAALNFFPAIAEAFYQKIPLLVLTADRPPELLNQQDGQMIMQQNVYGSHVLNSFELPCYTHGNEDLKATAKTVAKALQLSNGPVKGPVHINVPLCEPLYPAKNSLAKTDSYESLFRAPAMEKQTIPAALKNAWLTARKKMILVGQMSVNGELITPLSKLAWLDDAVILCDVLSNAQQVNTAPHFDFILSQCSEEALKTLQPDLLISLGGPVLSKSLKGWLKKQKPAHHFRIQPDAPLVDTYNNVTQLVQGEPADVLTQLAKLDLYQGSEHYKPLWQQLDTLAEATISEFLEKAPFSELHATDSILKRLPRGCDFQVANSSVIRYVSLLGNLHNSWTLHGNRGTSGIDGCTSTAVGAAIVNNRPTVLLTGDLAFLYDRNAFWNRHLPHNLWIIVLNNGGGGIFHLIDGPRSQPAALPYFTTPHQYPIKNIALDHGMEHYFCDPEQDLPQQFDHFFSIRKKPAVLEIRSDMTKNATVFRSFKKLKLV